LVAADLKDYFINTHGVHVAELSLLDLRRHLLLLLR
ncbi:hypothetical protein BAE44_0024664, partial [Dichanthelium oligosanthes]